MEVLTKIKNIEFCVGRTGKITPRADLDPVHLAGSIIKSVTLHNEDYIKENKDKPFCLYIAHAAPHSPMQGPNEKAIRTEATLEGE